jgi:hypothetical protein
MKIAIAGVSSTGKSTLAKAVAERTGMNLLWEQDVLDAAFAYCDRVEYKLTTRYMPDFTAADVAMFERGFIEYLYDYDSKHPSYITDASPTNTISYMLSLCYAGFSEDELSQHYTQILKWAKTFDAIFYLPFGLLPTVNDGRRIVNRNFLRMQDCLLCGIHDKHQDDLNIIELYVTDLEKRIEYVMKGLPVNEPSLLEHFDK